MSLQDSVSVYLILTGSFILLVSFVRLRTVFETLSLVEGDRRVWLRRRLTIHRGLVVFFVLGYLATAAGFVVEVAFLSKLLVAAIFLLGAFFVLIGIVLQNRMLSEMLKTLGWLVPICAACKKIRREEGDPLQQDDWQPIEQYISMRTAASFTHGFCPDCAEKIAPGFRDSQSAFR